MDLACSDKKRPGAERILRRLGASARVNMPKTLQLQGPHDLEILPNDRWDTYQTPYLSNRSSHSLIKFSEIPCSGEVKSSCLELERFLRNIVFDDRRWRPATNTSAIITLQPKDGFQRRFWVNGNLIGMRGAYDEPVRETCVMIERYPRFPTLHSLEEYVKARMLYANTTPLEIHAIASQIDKRFFVVGTIDVREFRLLRKVKLNQRTGLRYLTILLRWELESENWGHSSWKAYFEINSSQEIKFMSSRVSCHIDLRCWAQEALPRPWTFSRLRRSSPPLEHVNVTSRALTWLQMCHSVSLRKPAVILSIEDDPITGMPEDIPDGVPMDRVREALGISPPQHIDGNSFQFFWAQYSRQQPSNH